jgi:hypothetical protein
LASPLRKFSVEQAAQLLAHGSGVLSRALLQAVAQFSRRAAGDDYLLG